MKIISFHKYILDKEMKDYQLKDSPLVIDGHNFFYRSFKNSRLPFIFGSEANVYANYLRKKLDMFKRAGIECYFLFKGGDTDHCKKLEKLKPSTNPKSINDPVFIMKDVWKEVLKEQGFNYSTCIAESKNDCIALAQSLGCSVLSNDIEYCFRNASYISIETLRYEPNNCSINCKQFNLKTFLEDHSLSEDKVAIFAALSDTEIIPKKDSEHLFKKLGLFNKNFITRHEALLKWLAINNEKEILTKVSALLSSEIYFRFENYMKRVLKNMQNIDPTLVTHHLVNDQKLTVKNLDPLWFEKGVISLNIPTEYINLYKKKLFIINANVLDEQITEFMDILLYSYNLLTNFENNNIAIYFNKPDKKIININSNDCNVVKPRHPCNQSVFENGWEDLKRLKLLDHFLTENNINTDIIKKLPIEARMLFIALVYFARKKISKGMNVPKEVYCFIISYVMLHIVFDNKESITKKDNRISESDSAEAIRITANYFKCSQDEIKQIYDETKLKALVEIQFCIVQMNNLNVLCGQEYETTKYHKTFNGTFIYKLFLRMHDYEYNERKFIEDMFETAPSVQQCICTLITTFKELI